MVQPGRCLHANPLKAACTNMMLHLGCIVGLGLDACSTEGVHHSEDLRSAGRPAMGCRGVSRGDYKIHPSPSLLSNCAIS